MSAPDFGFGAGPDMTGREDYETPHAVARWWSKDGAWHIALPPRGEPHENGRAGLYWTDDSYNTREEAIAAIDAAQAAQS